MRSQRNPVGVVLAVLVLLLAALPALAVKTVSTSDGMTLTLTDTGAFSSLTVDGNTAPTLSGVAGGFYIVPMDGVAFNAARTTYYAGTQVTGTATQSGSDIHVTGTAQNQSFDIWLRGGLPYIKVEGTVTGPGSGHTFLVDFRLPVDATGWTWGQRPNVPQTIASGSGNWYFANNITRGARHPYESVNPYGTITKSASPAMGISLSPLFYPPSEVALQYNSQFGFQIEYDLGTTPLTTKHPNTAEIHFVLYKHDPNWGNRSAVQRYQSFFPQWFNRIVSGGNWLIYPGDANVPSTPEDYRIKFAEGGPYENAYTDAHGIISCVYVEPWGWHVWTTIPSLFEARNGGR